MKETVDGDELLALPLVVFKDNQEAVPTSAARYAIELESDPSNVKLCVPGPASPTPCVALMATPLELRNSLDLASTRSSNCVLSDPPS